MKKFSIAAVKGTAFVLLIFAFLNASAQKKHSTLFYQISVYHFTTTDQQNTINQYLKEALVPALHRVNIKTAGIFSALNNDTAADKTMYVLLPVQSLEEVAEISSKLNADAAYTAAGSAYLNAPFNAAPYTRIETILLQAFPNTSLQKPQLQAPDKDRVYELRSYEGATEKLHASKLKMFNTGDEISIFNRHHFNAIFYAEVVAGSHMPNLMYMTSFENMADREAHWKAFFDDTAFKQLGALPEYQHNVSKADITFLQPTDYSDL